MQTKSPILFVEINSSNYIFLAAKYNENNDLQIIEKIITSNSGIDRNKIINIEDAREIVKKNIQIIEDKLNFIFKEVIIILENFDYLCLNFSGFKKLNGSQLIKENITYILNALKSTVIENEKDKTILHIFNSKSILDGHQTENLPIGLFGNFYNHELTFILFENNDLKNINNLFKTSNLNVKKILIKKFIQGTHLINQSEEIEDFFLIKINENNSQIVLFDNSSFRYKEDFNFGSKIILNDISKVCSLKTENLKKILTDEYFAVNSYNEDDLLDKKYFIKDNFRKIKRKLLEDIVNARIDEILNIILKLNVNLNSFKKKNYKIYLEIEDRLVQKNFEKNFSSYFSKRFNTSFDFIKNFDTDLLISNAANLSFYGWKKEAIPITQTKNTLIARFFKSIFG